jgi:hypothetical protein
VLHSTVVYHLAHTERAIPPQQIDGEEENSSLFKQKTNVRSGESCKQFPAKYARISPPPSITIQVVVVLKQEGEYRPSRAACSPYVHYMPPKTSLDEHVSFSC